MPDRTFICRCEDVTLAELQEAFERGGHTVEEIKRYTGLGTGPCQGKECLSVLVGILCERNLAKPETVGPFTVRPPAEPASLAVLATYPDEDDCA